MLNRQSFNDKKVRNSPARFDQKLVDNPYYFFVLFMSFVLLNFYHFFEFKKGTDVSSCLFLVCAISQSVLEILVFAFAAYLVRSYCHKFLYYLLINLCFFFIVIHYIDFLLVRLTDFSVFFGISMILYETLENFIEILHLTGFSPKWWIFGSAVLLLSLPLLSAFLHRITMRLSRLRPLCLSRAQAITFFTSSLFSLALFEFVAFSSIKREDFQFYQRILPWKSTLFMKKGHKLYLNRPYQPRISEQEALEQLNAEKMHIRKKPNVYLFIAESLREDFITIETAPHTVAFRSQNICLGKTFSNANCTQLSWYSIFHSQYPFAWVDKKKEWKSGSIPLRAFKNLGYKIHVYSSAQLKYYGLKELIFGTKDHLVDSYHLYPHYPPIGAGETDAKAIDKLIEDHREKWALEGNLFLIFLDSTHFNYSWAKDYPLKFKPVAEEKINLRISKSTRDLDLIKNRYCNAIHYVDSLFGKLLSCLKKHKIYDRSLIVFTGDHGEEFFEEGSIFHASHLSRMQTEPPIYYKLGKRAKLTKREQAGIISSHVDIFPTLLDTLARERSFFRLFDGESILKKKRFPYAVSVRHNGGRNPSEFFIHNGKEKVIFRFHPFESKAIDIISLKDRYDRTIDKGSFQEINLYIRAHYGLAIDRLFSGIKAAH